MQAFAWNPASILNLIRGSKHNPALLISVVRYWAPSFGNGQSSPLQYP